MALRLDIGSGLPSTYEWLLIAAFVVGAVALIPQYVTLTAMQTGYLALVGALITLAVKVFTTTPTA